MWNFLFENEGRNRRRFFKTRWLKKRKWIIEGHWREQEIRHQAGYISMARQSYRNREKEVKGAEVPYIAASTMTAHHRNPYQRAATGPKNGHPAATDICSAILMCWLSFIASIWNVECNFWCRGPKLFWGLGEADRRLSPAAGGTQPGDTISRNVWLDDWLRIMGRLGDNRMSSSLKGKLNFKIPCLSGDWWKADTGDERDDTSLKTRNCLWRRAKGAKWCSFPLPGRFPLNTAVKKRHPCTFCPHTPVRAIMPAFPLWMSDGILKRIWPAERQSEGNGTRHQEPSDGIRQGKINSTACETKWSIAPW